MKFPSTPNATDKYSHMMIEDEDMAIELFDIFFSFCTNHKKILIFYDILMSK
jgi:hypothetical protein